MKFIRYFAYKVGVILIYSGLFYLYMWFMESDRYGYWPLF